MFKPTFILAACLVVSACSTAPDYQSLANCSDFSQPYIEPAEGQDHALFVGKRYNLSGLYEKWYPIVTHVDCKPVSDLWAETRLAPGKHTIRLRLNPEALGEGSGSGYGGGLLGATTSQKHTSDMDRSAQSFEINVEAGKNYYGYIKVLALGDSSFWVVDDEDKVVASSANFKPAWQETVLKNNKKEK